MIASAAMAMAGAAQAVPFEETINDGQTVDKSGVSYVISATALNGGLAILGSGQGIFGQLTITTSVDQGDGIYVWTGSGGKLTITSAQGPSSIATTGHGAAGIRVSNSGTINLTNTTITTEGRSGAHGIALIAGGTATLNNVMIETKFTGGGSSDGFGHNVGLYVTGGSTVDMTGGSIKTRGVFVGWGVEVQGAGSHVELTNVDIETFGGSGSDGVRLNNQQMNLPTPQPAQPSGSGSATITGGTITAHGANSRGVYAQDYSKAEIDGTTITTDGTAGHIVYGTSNTELIVRNANLKTTGSSAYGIWVGNKLIASNTKIETGTYAVSGGANNGFAVVMPNSNVIAELDRMVILTHGKNASGIWINGTSAGTGYLKLANSTITARHVNSSGVTMTYGNATISGTTFNIQGAAQDIAIAGVVANNNSKATLADSTITASGAGAAGVVVQNGSTVTVNGGMISTTGENYNASRGAHAFYVQQGATLAVNGATVITNGTDANLFWLTGNANTLVNNVTVTGGAYTTAKGASFSTLGGTGTVTLKDATVSSGAGRLLDIKAYNTTPSAGQEARFSLTADNSTMNGAALLDDYSTSSVELKNGSVWNVEADNAGTMTSVLTHLANNGSTIVFTGPKGNPLQASNYLSIRTGGYAGTGGIIFMNTYLGDDSSPSDLLIIDGAMGGTGTAVGSTALLINNTGGFGAYTTGDGIMVVDAINGATTANTAFTLSGRVAAGFYEYSLKRGSSSSSDSWYLVSTISSPNPGPGPGPQPTPGPAPERPNIRPEVPVNAAIMPLAIEYGFAVLDTLHERVGETWIRPMQPAYEERVVWCKDKANNHRCVTRTPVVPVATDRAQWFSGAWARVFADHGERQKNSGWLLSRGPNYDYTLAGVQAGLDVYGREASDGSIDKAGIYVAYGQLSGNVKQAWGNGKAGTVDFDAYTVGAYWTHLAASGWYTDAVAQGTWYSTTARSILGEQVKPDGWGLILSLEGGYAFDLGNGLKLEPQVQLAYQHLSFDSVQDNFGRFSFSDVDSVRGRVGLRLAKTWAMDDTLRPRLLTAWVRANVWHEFSSNSRATVSTLSNLYSGDVYSPLGGTWGEINIGASGQVSENTSLFASASYNRSLDRKGREGWDGRLGLTVRW